MERKGGMGLLAADLVPDVKGKADECKAIIKRLVVAAGPGAPTVTLAVPLRLEVSVDLFQPFS